MDFQKGENPILTDRLSLTVPIVNDIMWATLSTEQSKIVNFQQNER